MVTAVQNCTHPSIEVPNIPVVPMHIGIICPPALGHLNPMMALGQELRQRGHRITFFQVPDFERKIREHGLEYWAIGQREYPLGTVAQTIAQLRKLRDPAATFYWFEDQQRLSNLVCREVPYAAQILGIDAFIVDQNSPSGATVAEYLKLPFVSVSNGMMMHREANIPPVFVSWRYQKSRWARFRNQLIHHIANLGSTQFNRVLKQYRQCWNLPPLSNEALLYANSGLAQISQQPEAFDFPRSALPPHFHYVGPLRQPAAQAHSFPFERLQQDKPLVYASLGSLMQNREVFYCIASACKGLDIQLVLTHGGGLTEQEAAALPGSPLVVPYAPQLELLSRATLTITHAGLNTVLDSLTYGVPLVAIPIAFEQPAIGARIRWTGVGEVVPVNQLNVAQLRTAIQTVLADSRYRENALKMKNSIQQSGGVSKAADIVEKAVQTKQPTLVSHRSALVTHDHLCQS
jgi:zeaxanthin glucosyltransferase